MERTMLAWNLPNWITVMLMAAVGFLVLSLIYQVVAGGLLGGQPAAG